MKKRTVRLLPSTVKTLGAGTWWLTKRGRKPNAPAAITVGAVAAIAEAVVAVDVVEIVATAAIVGTAGNLGPNKLGTAFLTTGLHGDGQ